MGAHPTVKERGVPAAAVWIIEAGRKSLAIQPADGQGWDMSEIVKFAMMLISAALLAFAVVAQKPTIAIVGAVLFVAGLAADLRDVLSVSRAYRAGAKDPGGISTIDRIRRWLEGAITVAGLCMMFVAGLTYRGQPGEGLALAGMIIWFSAIAAYFISGLIIRRTTGIPLRLGHGGWYVSRRRFKKKRRRKVQQQPPMRP
jgi:hypothetical protein